MKKDNGEPLEQQVEMEYVGIPSNSIRWAVDPSTNKVNSRVSTDIRESIIIHSLVVNNVLTQMRLSFKGILSSTIEIDGELKLVTVLRKRNIIKPIANTTLKAIKYDRIAELIKELFF